MTPEQLQKRAEEKYPVNPDWDYYYPGLKSVAEAEQKAYIAGLSESDYWKNRCLAAEYLISSSAKTDIPIGYKNWHSLKYQSPGK